MIKGLIREFLENFCLALRKKRRVRPKSSKRSRALEAPAAKEGESEREEGGAGRSKKS